MRIWQGHAQGRCASQWMGWGALVADLDRPLDTQPGQTGTAGCADQGSRYQGAVSCRTFHGHRVGRARIPCAASARGLTTA